MLVIALLLQTRKQLNIRGIAPNCAEVRATELLFHLKINSFEFDCDLHFYAADTRIKISL